MAAIGKDINFAKSLLISGELVAIPTETVYGLAASAYDESAVHKIFIVKNRPSFDPLIVHVHSIDQLKNIVTIIPECLYKLAENFWPGPLTILFPKQKVIPDIVTSGLSYVAIRIPNHPLVLELLSSLPFPLAAPSANPFGYISPTTSQHVQDQLGSKVNYILDGGPCRVGLESTIVSMQNNELIIHRPGAILAEDLHKVANCKLKIFTADDNIQAPGTMKSHYAPSSKLILGNIEELIKKYSNNRIAVLSFSKTYDVISKNSQCILSASGSLEEAARNLFSALRYLDSLDVEYIISSFVPNIGIGLAINDRLQRAAS
jgi:L-threonylcarbamoyladenylate synthase